MKQLFIISLFLSTLMGWSQSNNPLYQNNIEDDWCLPAYVQKSENAGLYWEYVFKDADNLILTWKQLNPAENVYDWTILDTAITLDIPFFFRIWASDTAHTPAWVKNKYPDLPVLHWGEPGEQYPDLLGNTNPTDFYPLWHEGFATEFKKFLLAFKSRNYLANSNLKFMYVPCAWRWNEWELGPMLNEIIEKAPISSAEFESWFKEHLDDYADAANGYAHKMVFTGYGRIENPIYYSGNPDWFFDFNDTANGDDILTSYAVSIGMSVREGAQEYFNSSNDHFAWGAPSMTLNNINYQYIDESNPLHQDTMRLIATENEGFCIPSMLDICSYYHAKMSTLKALQLRVDWLNTSDKLIGFDSTLYQYARLTMNKTAANSPDAWVSLRQTYDPFFSANPPNPIYDSPLWIHRVTLPYRNWEKFLYQREVATDGIVTPVYQLNSDHFFDVYNYEAFEALRTTRDLGSNFIYFDVDSNFIYGGTNQVDVKITYLDNFSGQWWIEYDSDSSEVYKKSVPIVNSNDNLWKTITISLDNAGFQNRQNDDMDFRIYNGGSSDITVRFVRVIKSIDPVLCSKDYTETKIYPNPANSILYVETPLDVNEMYIFESSGKLVRKYDALTEQINISELANGTYYLQLLSNSVKVTKKFIVVH